MKKKRLVMVGKWHIIEPLGILYLLGIAKRLGWESRVVLIDEFNYEPLWQEINDFHPDLVCFSLWTGWHIQTFPVCDAIRRMGIPVIIGGPHATYSTAQCEPHADVVIKGDGFRNFRLFLEGKNLIGKLPGLTNVYFDPLRMAEGFPVPDRELVYSAYPFLAQSPIKSIMCTEGCPFKCSYCYAPAFNKLYGGFELNLRTVNDIINEARQIKERWTPKMIYFQDDIFGFRLDWLREFTKEWQKEIGIPWHCQIRLELTRETERLEIFRAGGCTGITLAIESGNAFLRQFVLERPMEHELIVEGIRKIQRLGMTLRTEQILAVPFSDIQTDLQTLALNNELNPEMAWTSILAPYNGTAMGTIASNFQFYTGNNDDLSETFFNRSVLQHTDRGIEAVEAHVRQCMSNTKDNPLLRMKVGEKNGNRANVYVTDGVPSSVSSLKRWLCEIRYLDETHNARYSDQAVMLQRIFNWLSRLPDGHELGTQYTNLPKEKWTWKTLGQLSRKHLKKKGYANEMALWQDRFLNELGYAALNEVPAGIKEHWQYFCFMPSGPEFAIKLYKEGFFEIKEAERQFDELGRKARHWLFERSLYKIADSRPPIAEVATRHQVK